MVAPHGAGLMNAMFLAPFSSVVEIFPYNLDHKLYQTVALTSAVGHYPIHTFNNATWAADPVRLALLSPPSLVSALVNALPPATRAPRRTTPSTPATNCRRSR